VEIARLRVTTPDGQVREHPIVPEGATIGAAPGNTIVIDHISVSPRHCRLVVADGGVQLIDHGSDVGTYLDGRRVPADVPTQVGIDTTLRIGSVDAVLLGSGAAATTGNRSNHNDGGVAPPTDTGASLTFHAALRGPADTIPPDGTASATVLIENRGRIADDYTLRIEDQPSWIQMSRSTLSLAPGTREEVTIVIRPPRSPEASAGQHELAVAVWSREQNHSIRVIGTFHVERFDQPAMRVQPPLSRRDFRVTLSNMGNAPVDYQLQGSDERGQLDFNFDQESVSVPHGKFREATLQVRPRARRLFSRSETVAFDVEGLPVGATPLPVHAGAQAEIRPPLRHWKWFLLAIVVLALAGAGGFIAVRGVDALPFFGGQSADVPALPPSTPTPTPEVAATIAPDTPTAVPPTPAPDELRVGGQAVVADLGPNVCLRVREEPDASDNTPIVGRICGGDVVNIVDGPVTSAQGFIFWFIQAADGLTGWSAEGPVDGSERFMLPVN
jgi:pSer/pThr/pTyr-binding forkhead associated (FHA) protein